MLHLGTSETLSAATCFHLTLVEEFALLVSGRRLLVPHMAERVRPIWRWRTAPSRGSGWPARCGRTAPTTAHRRVSGQRCGGYVKCTATSSRSAANDFGWIPGWKWTSRSSPDLAQRLIEAPDDESLGRAHLLVDQVELLPDWDEEWIAANRERYRLARLAALESAACALLARGQAGPALFAALAVVRTEPLRESARRIVMRAHLAQGNKVEAIQEHHRYRRLLRSDFGVDPSAEMDELLSMCFRSA